MSDDVARELAKGHAERRTASTARHGRLHRALPASILPKNVSSEFGNRTRACEAIISRVVILISSNGSV